MPARYSAWWRRRGLNPRPLGCEPNALPAELRPQDKLQYSAFCPVFQVFLKRFKIHIDIMQKRNERMARSRSVEQENTARLTNKNVVAPASFYWIIPVYLLIHLDYSR